MEKISAKLMAADVAECALFVALMVAGAFIKIPFPFMPLTFQTVIAVLSGLLLGTKKGIISMSAYAVLGLIGVPVFSSGGGFQYVVMPSFGYILGFIASAGVAGVAFKGSGKLWRVIVFSMLAFIADYVFGIAYFIAVWQLSGYEGLWQAVVTYNVVYMPKDATLCLLAAFLSAAVAPAIKKMRRKNAAHSQKESEGKTAE